MPTDEPAVSVVLPVRNAAPFLREALASLFLQTLQSVEIIAVDNGSTDGSGGILDALAARDPRLQVLRLAEPGIVGALALGFSRAAAPFVARMDADDVADPTRLARQLAVLQTRPELAALGTSARLIDEAGHRVGAIDVPSDHQGIASALLERNCMIHPTVMLRRAAFDAVGGYRRAYQGCEDYDLWLRLLDGYRLGNISEPLLSYRVHGTQATHAQLERRIHAEVAALEGLRRRRLGLADLGDPPGGFDAVALEASGLPAGAVARQVAQRAIGAARGAIGMGQLAAAQLALEIAGRQRRVGAALWMARLRARLRLLSRSFRRR